MSALLLEPLRKGRRHGLCVNRCEAASYGIKAGTHKVSIAGYPVGVVCSPCAKAWRQAWDGALNEATAAGEAPGSRRTTPPEDPSTSQASPQPPLNPVVSGTKHARRPYRSGGKARVLA